MSIIGPRGPPVSCCCYGGWGRGIAIGRVNEKSFGGIRVSLGRGLWVWPSHVLWSFLLVLSMAVDGKESGLTKYT